MKLMIAIVQDDDASRLISDLMEEGFSATKLATTGGFLRAGNTTLLMGVEDADTQRVMDIVERVCKSRKQLVPTQTHLGISSGSFTPNMIEVTVGGATVFVLSVDEFRKI